MIPECQKCGSPRDFSLKAAICRGCHRSYYREYQKVRRSNSVVREKERSVALAYRQEHLDSSRNRERLIKQQKQSWINSFKSGVCTDCLGSFPSCCMDFDHTRGTKLKGVGQILGCSKDKILTELAKCELVCACCHRLRTRSNWGDTSNKHRQKYYQRINEFKAQPCTDCGKSFPPIAMDFDHVRGEKVLSIAQMRSVHWDLVLIELAKCEVVCANCHRVRTSTRAKVV